MRCSNHPEGAHLEDPRRLRIPSSVFASPTTMGPRRRPVLSVVRKRNINAGSGVDSPAPARIGAGGVWSAGDRPASAQSAAVRDSRNFVLQRPPNTRLGRIWCRNSSRAINWGTPTPCARRTSTDCRGLSLPAVFRQCASIGFVSGGEANHCDRNSSVLVVLLDGWLQRAWDRTQRAGAAAK